MDSEWRAYLKDRQRRTKFATANDFKWSKNRVKIALRQTLQMSIGNPTSILLQALHTGNDKSARIASGESKAAARFSSA